MKKPTFYSSIALLKNSFNPLSIVFLALLILSVSSVGASTVRRFVLSQTTGSSGSTDFLQTTATGGALQGEVDSSAYTSFAYPFGVLGYFNEGTQFGIGTAGVSANGYGVAGQSNSTQNAGIFAAAGSSGDGLDATTTGSSNNANAVFGSASGSSTGVFGQSASSGYGIFGQSYTGTAIMGYTTANTGGIGMVGASTGEGVTALGYSGNTSHAALSVVAETSGTQVATFSNTSSSPQQFIVQANSQNRSKVTSTTNSDVQVHGDLYVVGKIYQNCNAFPATSSTSCYDVGTSGSYGTSTDPRSSSSVQLFGSRQTLPTIEDFGEAHLQLGNAYIHLDPSFASMISQTKPYLVFVTPLGDSKSLYVTNKSSSGFGVRESGNGRSTMAFDFRIVAVPTGDQSIRLSKAPSIGENTQHNTSARDTAAQNYRKSLFRSHNELLNPFRKVSFPK